MIIQWEVPGGARLWSIKTMTMDYIQMTTIGIGRTIGLGR
jgi:hypothetical protein